MSDYEFFLGGSQMGLIYLISNTENNKLYVGKTIRSLQTRWNEHLRDVYNSQKNNNKLYRAMNKYGIDKFKIELLEDNVPDDLLGIREQEYIKKFDSYYNGYNSTFGGEGESSVDIEELKLLLLAGNNFSEIAKITGHTRKTVSTRLRQEGLSSPYKNISGNLNKGKKIKFNNCEFDSLTLLAKFLKDNVEIFKDKKISTIVKGISKNAKLNKPYCGYLFEYL